MRNPQNCKVKLVYRREQLKARVEFLYVKESSWFYLSVSILFCQFLLQYMSCSNTSKRRPLRVQTVQTVNFSFFSNTCLPLHLWLAYILPRENEGTESWLGYVDFTKVIFSFRRKRKSISPDVRMIPFTRWSGNWKVGQRGNTFCQ